MLERSICRAGGLDSRALAVPRVADLLGHVESWLERAVEGGARALFRQRLQPIELAKAATRAMQRQEIVGPDGIEVPNAYRLLLHPRDFEQVAPYRASLEPKIAQYLATFAADRGRIPLGEIQVSIAADPRVRRFTVRADTAMLDAAPSTREVAPLQETAPLPKAARNTNRAGLTADLTLVLEDGRQVEMPSGPLSIGRALDNGLVIADGRVSRYHVQIRHEGGGLIVRDVGSTNGTAVGGHIVTESPLTEGDDLSLGGYAIQLRARRPASPTRG